MHSQTKYLSDKKVYSSISVGILNAIYTGAPIYNNRQLFFHLSDPRVARICSFI